MDNRNTNSQNPLPRRDDESRGFDYAPHRPHKNSDSPYNRLTGRYNPISEEDLAAARAAREERAAQRSRASYDASPVDGATGSFPAAGSTAADGAGHRRRSQADVPLANSPRYNRSQRSLDEEYEYGYSSRETAASRQTRTGAPSGKDRASQRAQEARADRRRGSDGRTPARGDRAQVSRSGRRGNRVVVNEEDRTSRRPTPDWYSGNSDREAQRWEQNRAARERNARRGARNTVDPNQVDVEAARRGYGDEWRDEWRRDHPDGSRGNPAWYDEAPRSRAGRDPRPAIDTTQRSRNWGSRGEGDAVRGRGYRETSASSVESGGILDMLQSLLAAIVDFVRGNLRLVIAVVIALVLLILVFNGIRGCVAGASEGGDAATNNKQITISFAGDCTLGGDEESDEATSFDAKYAEVGDPAYFFANVKDALSKDDLTIVNLEGPLTTSTNAKEGEDRLFKGDPSYANILTSGSVEAVTVANNHAHDYGDEGLQETVTTLDNAGVLNFGYERIAYTEIDGVKVAMVSGNMVDDPNDDLKLMIDNIAKAKEEGAQLIIAYPHWGIEKDEAPGGTQMQGGRQLIDAGAHIVVGSHSHVIQGYEKYDGRYIVYNMGSFCFGGDAQPEDFDTWIFQQTFSIDADGNVATDDQINIVPCSISSDDSINNYQPTALTGDGGQAVINKINNRTAMVTDLVTEFNSGENTGGSSSSGDSEDSDN